jgi:predicted RNase H-like nuclease (RuvC/YqgF family)
MSPIGRIFSVLNLILAALFLGWASQNLATSHQYKEQLADANAEHADAVVKLNETIDGQRQEVDNLRTEKDDLDGQMKAAVAAQRRVEGENEQYVIQIQNLSSTGETNAASISAFESHIASLESAKDEAVAGKHDAEADRDSAQESAQAANTSKEETEKTNAELENQITDLKVTIATLDGDLAELDTNFKTLVDITGVSLKDVLAQKLIKGSVLEALYDIKPGLVALNVGSEDEVERGYTFEIFNGGEYKGRIRIENVRDNSCTGLIIDMLDGQTIKQGDSASTRL